MYNFNFQKPHTINDAINAIKAGGQPLAGGQSLIPTLKQRLANPETLVDLSGLRELDFIKEEAGNIIIGATTRHVSVANSAVVKKSIPALAHLAGMIGDIHVRNRGTIGGSVANNDPAACYPAAVLALNATITTSAGRNIHADDFFNGLFTTSLDDGEIITQISFPIPHASNYQKFVQPASRFSLVGVFLAKNHGGVRIAVTGAGNDGVFRATEFETALNANFSVSAIHNIHANHANLITDLHGSGAYRASLIATLIHDAIKNCA